MTQLQTVDDAAVDTAAVVFNSSNMQSLVKFSEMMAQSSITIPKHLIGKPADCLAIAMQAMQWGMNPFAVAQKTHFVNGAIGYEAQLVNAVIQEKSISGPPEYEYRGEGQNIECRVGCVPRGGTERVWGQWLSAASQTTKNSPLWKTNVRQQLGYLQLKNWARAYAPGAILGVYTRDELEDHATVEVSGPRRKSERVNTREPELINTDTGEITASTQESTAHDEDRIKAPLATPTGTVISSGHAAYLRKKLASMGMPEDVVCNRFNVGGIELLTTDQFDALKAELLTME